MNQYFENITIESIATVVPKNTVYNSDFKHLLSEKEIKFFEKTVGIAERRWCDENITSSDIAIQAVYDLIKNKLLNIDDLECLIFLSQTPDYKIPFTSNIIQSKLGIKKNILCLDVNAGCAGFIQGLSMAFSIAQTLKKNQKVLLIVAETLSKILSRDDRATTTLFGDGAAAIVIAKNDNLSKSYFNFFSDGNYFDAIKIEDGGYRNPFNKNSFDSVCDENNGSKSKVELSMDGAKVFDFTIREVAPSVQQLIDFSGIEINEIDYHLFHQSNKFIINRISNLLNIPKEKVLINIEKYANTSGVSIPLLIASFRDIFANTSKVMFSGYGSGLTWGNCITDISRTVILPTSEF